MKITSPSFEEGWKIPEKFTADGMDVNPELIIGYIPEGAESLVLIVDDPDAKRVAGYTWVHWVLFNIPVEGNVVKIPEDSIVGTPGESTYRKKEYGGPNPPPRTGKHNYHFKVFALNEMLDLPEMAPLSDIERESQGKILDKAEIVGQYWRD